MGKSVEIENMTLDQSVTGHQIAAARTLADLTQKDLAERANISVPTIKRMEGAKAAAAGSTNNVRAVIAALESAGIIFLDGDYSGSGGPGVRLTRPSGSWIDVNEDEVIQYKDVYDNDAPGGAGG